MAYGSQTSTSVSAEVRVGSSGALRADSDLEVLDVRQPGEWAAGHIKNARFVTGSELPQRVQEFRKNLQVAVICGSGYRSSVAASFLQYYGYRNFVNVLGGMNAWKAAKLPIIND